MKTMSVKELREKLKNDEVYLIDVREIWEYKTQHIKEANHIPLKQISLEKVNCSNKPIVIHCAAGIRSADAASRLLRENPNLEIYNLVGGIRAWCDAGFPVESENKKKIPIERQVFITAGLIVLLGMCLGYFVNPLFYWITVLIGAGLVFAGISGWCGLAIILGKMPWNK